MTLPKATDPMQFYVGLHQPADAIHFMRAFISINRVRGRKKPVKATYWILDSGAFSELEQFGGYRHTPLEYALEVNRLRSINSNLVAAVSQDFMCEEFILNKTGLQLEEHQRLTIERYDALKVAINETYLMPVLQGYSLQSYISHIEQYGTRLTPWMYTGVGSVCKRNDVRQIEEILSAIKQRRPDLLLHGFGLKTTALASKTVRACLTSADSMSWSFAARKQGRNANDWREAKIFVDTINRLAISCTD